MRINRIKLKNTLKSSIKCKESLRNQTNSMRKISEDDIIDTNKGGFSMSFSYNKLWKLLIDKRLNKTDLATITGLSKSTIAKLTKGENVNTKVLERICSALDCKLDEIVEVEKEC